jgi:PKD repeat protein
MFRGVILVFCTSMWAFAQCPTVDFSISPTACRNTVLTPEATIANAVSYSWDFCDGSVANTPSSITNLSSALITEPYDFQPFEESGVSYMVSVNYNTGKVIRYNFGNSYANAPVITDLGTFGVISRPLGIGLWKESGSVYALVATEGGSLFRLNFGSSIANTPTATQVTGVTGLNDHRHIEIIEENGAVLALITGGTNRVLSVLNFGSSILNTPSRTFISIPAASFMTGLELAIECGNRYALISGYQAGVFKLDFGNSYLNTPVVTSLASIPETLVWGLSLVKSAGNYHAFMFNDASGVVRADFGNSLNNTPTTTTLGFFGGLNLAIGLSIVKTGSTYFCASVNYTNGRLNVLQFPKSCSITSSFANDPTPDAIQYAAAGTYQVTLSARGSENELVTITKPVTVTALIAPDLIITESGNCLTNAITFTGTQQTGVPLNTLLWDFGDGNNASGQNAPHTYASTGNYDVLLEATAADGCFNRLVKSVPIYDAPIANFSIPAVSPICTNQNYLFNNASTVDPDFATNWEWRVNGSVVSSAEDLSYTFTNTSNQEIRLKASIPGCNDEKIQNIASLVDGPVPDFTFTGHCEDANIVFTDASTGSITTHAWDFDDGNISPIQSPTNVFSNIGTYDVQLTVSNAAGCHNSISKPVVIRSKPQVNFAASLPPFSCSGTPTQFNDLTPGPVDSNLTSWQWNFGDAGSSQNTSTLRNPQHTYATATNYDVSLTVSTNFACSASLQLSIPIAQSPVPDFTHAATCDDVPASFSGTASGTVSSWSWTIGGSPYAIQNPTHTFTNPGNSSATLSVTGSNSCIGMITKPIVVPVKLVPDFAYTRHCVEQQTEFTDITSAAADPVVARNWDFFYGVGSGSPATFTFQDIGNTNITLTVTAQSGCSYPITKLINILPSLKANFVASALVSAPQTIQFANTSTNASSYQWTFGDPNNSISTQSSPQFTYPAFGQYEVELFATNPQNCSHAITKMVDVGIHTYDVALNGLELLETSPDVLNPVVTIFNHGTTAVSNITLLIYASGSVVEEVVAATIQPNSSYRYTLSYEMTDESYLCIESALEDVTLNDNRVCLNIEKSFVSFAPYPNPGNGVVYAEWISEEAGMVNLTIINSMGQEVKSFRVNSTDGLNSFEIDLQDLGAGPYLLKVQNKAFNKVYRVIVAE